VAGDALWKALNRTHRTILRLPGGGRFWRRGGMPVLELTTTGRRSRLPRSVMLTSPVQDGDSYVVVASRAGDACHPAWFENLRADPRVQVRTGGGVRAMVARVATPTERASLWPQVIAVYPPYAAYHRKAEREIPLVVLAPAGADRG
jgi:deazaflavin-dependent oxidoreductase (nitroreductase family)